MSNNTFLKEIAINNASKTGIILNHTPNEIQSRDVSKKLTIFAEIPWSINEAENKAARRNKLICNKKLFVRRGDAKVEDIKKSGANMMELEWKREAERMSKIKVVLRFCKR